MSGREYALWLAEYQREPWGELRGDLQAGIVAAQVTAMAGKVLKQGATVSASSFLPNFDAEPPPEIEPDEFFKGL